jgi:uracil-DNA glycosylase
MVFGEGPRSAEVMLVGEQLGDHEDRAYVTNSVKHFKFVQMKPRVIVALGATAAQALLIADLARAAAYLQRLRPVTA